ncbi:MAG: GNAT family N-acetyltransferase [Pseudomonadota bacterium]
MPAIDSARFAAASDATWPAERVAWLGGWKLRFTDGAGSRAASIWATGAPGMALETALDEAEAAYHASGLPPRAQLWPGDEALDALLETRGYRLYDRSLLMVRRLSEPLSALQRNDGAGDEREACTAIRVTTPLEVLDQIWAEGGVGPARRAALDRAPGPKHIFLGRVGMRPAGAAAIVLDGDIAVTQALYVSPIARRRGLAAVLMAALAEAAAAEGARLMTHAVVEENAGARTLYERLGFRAFGAYHYRELCRVEA